MADYGTNDPKGWGGDPSRGAALGRCSIKGEANTITVRRSPLDRQGYDRNGTYFGDGQPLYWVADEEGEVDYMIRGQDRSDALNQVIGEYPKACVLFGERLSLPCFGAGDEPCPEDGEVSEEYGWDLCEYCEWTEQESEEDDDA